MPSAKAWNDTFSTYKAAPMKERKLAPWRIIAALAAVIFIVYMWVKKDIASVYSTLPPEQLLPVIVTTVAVTLLKVGLLTGIILLVKCGIRRLRK